MNNVVELDRQRPHRTTAITCGFCEWKWVAVYSEGTKALQCPLCHQWVNEFGTHISKHVRYDDYAALLARVEAAESEVTRLQNELRNGFAKARDDMRVMLELQDVINALKGELSTLRESMRWIPVTEQVEIVTRSILFADCGADMDWQDNLHLGEAAIKAYRPIVQHWRNDALEAAAKIAERYGVGDAAYDIREMIKPTTWTPTPEDSSDE